MVLSKPQCHPILTRTEHDGHNGKACDRVGLECATVLKLSHGDSKRLLGQSRNNLGDETPAVEAHRLRFV